MATDNPAISSVATHLTAAFAAMGVNLDNIVADETDLVKQIKDLRDNAGSLSAADMAKLNALVAAGDAMVARSKTVADSIPDAPSAATPVISNLNPSSVPPGSPATLVTINGSGFTSSSIAGAKEKTSPYSTTFISASQLQVTVPSSDLTTSGTLTFVVMDGGVASNESQFQVTAPAPPSL